MKRGKMKQGSPIPKASGLPRLLKLAAYSTLGLGTAHSRAETVITFGGFTALNTHIASIPDYGDNITANSLDWSVIAGRDGIVGTPNITLDWIGDGWDTYIDWNARGNVAQTDFNAGPAMSLLFTPSPEAGVRLLSFELDEWFSGGNGSIDWSIIGNVSGELASGNWTMNNAGGRSLLAPNVAGRFGETLSLNFTLQSGSPSYFAMDNLTFDQVPEPSTLALGALGAAALGAAAMRRRRRA